MTDIDNEIVSGHTDRPQTCFIISRPCCTLRSQREPQYRQDVTTMMIASQ